MGFILLDGAHGDTCIGFARVCLDTWHCFNKGAGEMFEFDKKGLVVIFLSL